MVSSRIQQRGFKDLVHSLSIVSHTAKRSFRHPDMSLSAYDPVDRRKNVHELGNPIPSPVIVPASLNATWRHGGFCLMILARGEISESAISYLDRADGRNTGVQKPSTVEVIRLRSGWPRPGWDVSCKDNPVRRLSSGPSSSRVATSSSSPKRPCSPPISIREKSGKEYSPGARSYLMYSRPASV